jgi:hypothetical protein
MKTKILFLAVMFTSLTVGAQVREVKPIAEVKTVMVSDTTLVPDSRLQFLAETIVPAIQKHLSEELARQKVAGEVTLEQETQVVFNEIIAAVQKYAQNFLVVNQVQVDPVQIEQEFNQLNQRVEQLQSDKDIKYIEAVQEFRTIQERQEQLARYYQQITEQVQKK